jgi:hypothetical protein
MEGGAIQDAKNGLASPEANAPNAASIFAALAQLVERLIRNE